VQIEPMKPTLKAPGTKHLKPKGDEQLSSFAFDFYLRRYNSGTVELGTVGQCRLTVSKSVFNVPMVQRLKLAYDELL
jgi:hypothetical protein